MTTRTMIVLDICHRLSSINEMFDESDDDDDDDKDDDCVDDDDDEDG